MRGMGKKVYTNKLQVCFCLLSGSIDCNNEFLWQLIFYRKAL